VQLLLPRLDVVIEPRLGRGLDERLEVARDGFLDHDWHVLLDIVLDEGVVILVVL